MSIYKKFDQVVQYLSDAIARIFTPTNDTYPATGVQPFAGEVSKRSRASRSDW
ncbi:MAG: hypothetical protein VKJ46_10970 [Leptolyngbyaceae bacterium]|nr:hypothetical protein [Leptolyngbyaceae bacterium]